MTGTAPLLRGISKHADDVSAERSAELWHSFEVQFPDRRSQYFYWDDISARRLWPETLDRETALRRRKRQRGFARGSFLKRNGPGQGQWPQGIFASVPYRS